MTDALSLTEAALSNKNNNKNTKFKMQIKNLKDTVAYLRDHMLNTNETSENVSQCEEVNPVVIRKIPKFSSRDRHLAIRRRKPPTSPESQRSESVDFSVETSSENE